VKRFAIYIRKICVFVKTVLHAEGNITMRGLRHDGSVLGTMIINEAFGILIGYRS